MAFMLRNERLKLAQNVDYVLYVTFLQHAAVLSAVLAARCLTYSISVRLSVRPSYNNTWE